jgi:hypothetical protein
MNISERNTSGAESWALGMFGKLFRSNCSTFVAADIWVSTIRALIFTNQEHRNGTSLTPSSTALALLAGAYTRWDQDARSRLDRDVTDFTCLPRIQSNFTCESHVLLPLFTFVNSQLQLNLQLAHRMSRRIRTTQGKSEITLCAGIAALKPTRTPSQRSVKLGVHPVRPRPRCAHRPRLRVHVPHPSAPQRTVKPL